MWAQRGPPKWEIHMAKPYSSWEFKGFFIPKNPKVEHNKYHGSTRTLEVHPIEQWKKPWFFRVYIGDEILPSYIGIIS